MDNDQIKEVIDTLHPLERKVLPVLKEGIKVEEIEADSKLSEVEVIRALQWLENKKALRISTKTKELIELDDNGKKYFEEGLPERKLLEALKSKELSLKEAQEKSKLDEDEFKISLGVLKNKLAVSLDKGNLKLTDDGRALLNGEMFEEVFLNKLGKEITELNSLFDIDKKVFEDLRKRKKIVKIVPVKTKSVELTDLGRELIKVKLPTGELIEGLTPLILKNNSWKGKKFRKYDVKINVPKIYPAKRHFVNQSVDYIKRIWLDMGFKEMQGSIVQSSFWNFDALFVPQDHPAREMQDTFFVKGESKLNNKKVIDEVKKSHEQGWKYKWDINVAKENLLRTHTTVLSARTIASLKKEDLPAKFFSVGKCFRNETVDWSHLFELVQVEGIVIDENNNLRNLLGYLKEFFKKLGFEKIRIRPGYFPYTEPSAEIDVYHPIKKKWVELGGSGIFRPEVVKPLLGKDVSVLAWGIGLERSIMDYYVIKDIRDLYKNDLKQLKEMKYWLK